MTQITERIDTPAAPNLPLAPLVYERSFQEAFNNILRLYFNRLDNALQNAFGGSGGRFLNNPYCAAQRNTDFTFVAPDTAYQVTFDQLDYQNGATLNLNDGIQVDYPGIYNYQFSVQLRNADTQIHSAWIWLRKNGVDEPGTGSKFDVISRHGGIDGFVIAACNFFVQLEAGDTIEMWAAVNNIQVSFDAAAAQTTPFAMPSIPSVVATLSFVSSY